MTLIPRGRRPIAPYLPPVPGWLSVVVILRPGSRGPDCGGFHFSHAPTLTIGSTAKLLVGCSGGRFAQHLSDSLSFGGRLMARLSLHVTMLDQQ